MLRNTPQISIPSSSTFGALPSGSDGSFVGLMKTLAITAAALGSAVFASWTVYNTLYRTSEDDTDEVSDTPKPPVTTVSSPPAALPSAHASASRETSIAVSVSACVAPAAAAAAGTPKETSSTPMATPSKSASRGRASKKNDEDEEEDMFNTGAEGPKMFSPNSPFPSRKSTSQGSPTDNVRDKSTSGATVTQNLAPAEAAEGVRKKKEKKKEEIWTSSIERRTNMLNLVRALLSKLQGVEFEVSSSDESEETNVSLNYHIAQQFELETRDELMLACQEYSALMAEREEQAERAGLPPPAVELEDAGDVLLRMSEYLDMSNLKERLALRREEMRFAQSGEGGGSTAAIDRLLAQGPRRQRGGRGGEAEGELTEDAWEDAWDDGREEADFMAYLQQDDAAERMFTRGEISEQRRKKERAADLLDDGGFGHSHHHDHDDDDDDMRVVGANGGDFYELMRELKVRPFTAGHGDDDDGILDDEDDEWMDDDEDGDDVGYEGFPGDEGADHEEWDDEEKEEFEADLFEQILFLADSYGVTGSMGELALQQSYERQRQQREQRVLKAVAAAAAELNAAPEAEEDEEWEDADDDDNGEYLEDEEVDGEEVAEEGEGEWEDDGDEEWYEDEEAMEEEGEEGEYFEEEDYYDEGDEEEIAAFLAAEAEEAEELEEFEEFEEVEDFEEEEEEEEAPVPPPPVQERFQRAANVPQRIGSSVPRASSGGGTGAPPSAKQEPLTSLSKNANPVTKKTTNTATTKTTHTPSTVKPTNKKSPVLTSVAGRNAGKKK